MMGGHRVDCGIFYYAGECDCGFLKPWPTWARMTLGALALLVAAATVWLGVR